MPYNRVANIRRRLRQTDANMKRAMRFLADVMVTLVKIQKRLDDAGL